MTTASAQDSVGIVTPEIMKMDEPITLDCGRSLPHFQLEYETYGTLNAAKSNAVLVCHALSGHHHAAGRHHPDDKKPGWWDKCIGPGKMIDTNRFFVICIANLASYSASTGPSSPHPETGKPYGPDFPVITIGDWVRSQDMFRKKLDIEQWAAVIGGSMGGMQVMQWAIDFPDCLRHAVVIASAPRLTAQNIAFNEVARQAITTDPEFHAGRYLEYQTVPRRGLMLARMLAHITYLSSEAMRSKFGRDLREGQLKYGFDVEFQIESYLRYQGSSFVNRFDANTYLLMTKCLDYFDPAEPFGGDLAAAFAPIKAKFLVESFTSDWRFEPARSHEIVDALVKAGKQVSYAEIESVHGHDDFLLTQSDYVNTTRAYLDQVAKEVGA